MAVFNPFNTKEEDENKSDERVLVTLPPAKFDIFTKVLDLFNKSNESIKIKNNLIVQKFGPAVISSDITNLLEEDQQINIDIIDPSKYIKLFKNFRNNEDVKIIDDESNKRYIFTNDEIKLFLPKQVTEEENADDTLMPDFEDSESMFELKINKETSKQLIGLSKNVNAVEYLVQDNKLKGIHIPETAIFLFSDYTKDPKAKTLDETNAEQIFRTGIFLAVPAEDYIIYIGKLKNGNYFSYTDCDTGFVHVNVYEDLKVTTGGSLLI